MLTEIGDAKSKVIIGRAINSRGGTCGSTSHIA